MQKTKRMVVISVAAAWLVQIPAVSLGLPKGENFNGPSPSGGGSSNKPSAPSRPSYTPAAPSRPSAPSRPTFTPSAPSRPASAPAPYIKPSERFSGGTPAARPAPAAPAPYIKPSERFSGGTPATRPAPVPAAPAPYIKPSERFSGGTPAARPAPAAPAPYIKPSERFSGGTPAARPATVPAAPGEPKLKPGQNFPTPVTPPLLPAKPAETKRTWYGRKIEPQREKDNAQPAVVAPVTQAPQPAPQQRPTTKPSEAFTPPVTRTTQAPQQPRYNTNPGQPPRQGYTSAGTPRGNGEQVWTHASGRELVTNSKGQVIRDIRANGTVVQDAKNSPSSSTRKVRVVDATNADQARLRTDSRLNGYQSATRLSNGSVLYKHPSGKTVEYRNGQIHDSGKLVRSKSHVNVFAQTQTYSSQRFGSRTIVNKTYVYNDNRTIVRNYGSYGRYGYYGYVPRYSHYGVEYSWAVSSSWGHSYWNSPYWGTPSYVPPVSYNYSWTWHGGWGWYGTYNYYYRPRAVYVSSYDWLTDYLVINSLRSHYDARLEAERNAARIAAQESLRAAQDAEARARYETELARLDAEQAKTAAAQARAEAYEARNSAQNQKEQITEEMKIQIAKQVKEAIDAQKAAAEQSEKPEDREVTASLEKAVADQKHIFVVSDDLGVTLNGTEGTKCEIGQGDLIQLAQAVDPSQPVATMKVLTAKEDDDNCDAGSEFMVSMAQLQEFLNDFHANVEEGLEKMKKEKPAFQQKQ